MSVVTPIRWPRFDRFAIGIGAVLAIDLAVWQMSPGLGWVVAILVSAGAAQMCLGRVDGRAWAILVLCLIPAVDLIQPLSVVIAWAGILVFCAMNVAPGHVMRAVVWLPVWGMVQNARGVFAVALLPVTGRWPSLRNWALPVVLGAGFVALFAVANPVVEAWLLAMSSAQGPDLAPLGRWIFWAFVALMVWPMLCLRHWQTPGLRAPKQGPHRPLPGLSEGSILRSLVVFNAIFALQTGMDLAYLGGGLQLPEGITYAQYAHRGAYPLLVAALMAGGFALMTQRWLVGRPLLRILLLIWVGQTVLLVISSLLRLELYVGSYGLTRMRFAAGVWMGAVAGGLGLLIWQVRRGHSMAWLCLRSGALAAAVLYLVALINVDGVIARHNLRATGLPLDRYYLCQLGQGAVPAIAGYEARTGERLCPSHRPWLSVTTGWREWGYRNHRLRRNLLIMKGDIS